MITIRETCDACGGDLNDVFSMGTMPLANALLSADDLGHVQSCYPLVVAECQSCTLAQLRHVVSPAVLYDDYCFYSGASSPNREYFDDLAAWVSGRLVGSKRVLEIGSNDGTLLVALERHGCDVTGIDPAVDQCCSATVKLQRGRVCCRYWSENTARELDGTYDAVVACNVLAHSDNLTDFLSGAKLALRPGGLLVIEVQHLLSLLEQGAFELIYHEHVNYFDEFSLWSLLSRAGFDVLSSQVTISQCGTLRMWAVNDDRPSQFVSKNGEVRSASSYVPCRLPHDWRAFRQLIDARRASLLSVVDQAQQSGRRVCFYGAPAKAAQIANYWRLGTDTIQFATDTTPAKQGRWIPGAMIPVVSPDHLMPDDTAIVAAWNYWPQIVSAESEFLASGGCLVNPAATTPERSPQTTL